jgi:hypothetical protein
MGCIPKNIVGIKIPKKSEWGRCNIRSMKLAADIDSADSR